MSLNGPVESLLEVTLNAPADGYAVVTGSADFFLIHNTGTSSHGFPGVSNQSTLPSGDENKDILLPSGAASGHYS